MSSTFRRTLQDWWDALWNGPPTGIPQPGFEWEIGDEQDEIGEAKIYPPVYEQIFPPTYEPVDEDARWDQEKFPDPHPPDPYENLEIVDTSLRVGSKWRTKRNGDVYEVVSVDTDTVTISWVDGKAVRTLSHRGFTRNYVEISNNPEGKGQETEWET